MRFEEIAEVLAERVGGLEPETYSGADAARLAEVTARIRNLADTASLLFARRAADTGAWVHATRATSAEQWLAGISGTSERAARDALVTVERLDALPATAETLRAGELSLAQAAHVTAAASANPAAETRLLRVARRDGIRALREESQRVLTAAGDEDAERARVRRERHLGTRAEGLATRGWFSGPTEEVAELLAVLKPLEQDAFNAARHRGEHEPAGAYRFDALVALARGTQPGDDVGDAGKQGGSPKRSSDGVRITVGLSRLLGGEPAPGEEMCEIPGVGPVPAAHAREVLAHGLLELVVSDGVDVTTVVSSTRHVPAPLRLAIAHRDGNRCKVAGCDHTLGIERHHTLGFTEHHRTAYDTLGVICAKHHDLVHHRGHEIVADPDGTWRLRAPPHTDAA